MIRVLEGDCRTVLPTLPAESVQCVVTSPPYFGLRDYGVAGQLGLEATPDLYIQTMIAVFREVRRVLRDDGTLWLNVGDSYASHDPSGYRPGEFLNPGGRPPTKQGQHRNKSGNYRPGGAKPKDLLMMPARLALALQAPYYTGTIKSEADRIWLAAMIDTEGCMFIHKRKAGESSYAKYTRADGTEADYKRTQDQFGSGLEVANTSQAIVERCMAIVGKGSICSQSPDQNNRRKQTIYRWNLRSNECREVVREIYPHLVAKQQQARILIGCPPSGDKASAAHAAMIALHNGEETSVDFPEPASMFEPGWYVRSDIIWKKPNPMPESVTDRPTSAHEHIFLLTKSARYFFDSEAIKETSVSDHPSGNGYKRDARLSYLDANGARGNDDQWQVRPTRSCRNIWTIATAPYSEAHFATFPPALAERCIKAGTSERGCCAQCGKPWVRQIETSYWNSDSPTGEAWRGNSVKDGAREQGQKTFASGVRTRRHDTTTGWSPGCQCNAPTQPCTVLDPFAGAGTTGLVADRLQRDAVMIELNPAYTAMLRNRITNDAPLFAPVT